jgi:hypothetical protein
MCLCLILLLLFQKEREFNQFLKFHHSIPEF